MLDRVKATIARHAMLPRGSRVVAAVSGGADSVCLLHVLRELAEPLGITVAGVAHVNHKLRGEESEADRHFVADLGTPFHTIDAPVAKGNLEQEARHARRAFFTSLIERGDATHVALGHTRDDQAETVLFRILRGSGISGLAGILPVTVSGIVRPLLEIGRADVEEYLRSRGIAWREDSSNRDPRFARNRIRSGLLPSLTRDWNPRLAQNLAHLADLAYEEERWWAAAISSPAVANGAVDLDASVLAGLPRAAARRMIRHAIRQVKGNLRGVEFRHVEDLIELATAREGGGRLPLPGASAIRSFGTIRLERRASPTTSEPQPVIVPGAYPSPDGNSMIHLELCSENSTREACATLKAELGWETPLANLELRGWRMGDQYRPLGQAHEQKLKHLFQVARVPSWQRPSWTILSSGDRILWAKGFGVAAEFARQDGSGPTVRIREVPLPGR